MIGTVEYRCVAVLAFLAMMVVPSPTPGRMLCAMYA